MKNAKQTITAILTLLIILAVCIFFYRQLPYIILVLLLAEYFAECHKYKTWYPPLAKLPIKIYQHWHTKWTIPAPLSEKEKVHLQSEPIPANVITSIADIKAKPFFLQCCIGDYSPIGTGTHEQLHTAFIKLLSKYYQVKDDIGVKHEVKLKVQIAILQLRDAQIKTMCNILNKRYMEEAVKGLKDLFTVHGICRYQLTPESLERDLQMILSGEISNKIKYDTAVKELEKLYEDAKGKSVSQNELARETALFTKMMDINFVEKVNYNVNEMSVLEYAIAEKRLAKHYEMLENQTKK